MSFSGLLTQTVEILPYDETGVDDYNDPAPDFGDPISSPAYLEKRQSNEDNRDRETAVSGWLLFLPASAAIDYRDRVRYGDMTFEVDGTINEVWNPRTASVHHIEVDLALVEDLVEESS